MFLTDEDQERMIRFIQQVAYHGTINEDGADWLNEAGVIASQLLIDMNLPSDNDSLRHATKD